MADDLTTLGTAHMKNFVSSTAAKFGPGNFVTEGTTNKVGVTMGIKDPSDANPLVLIKWLADLSTEWMRSEYLNLAAD